MGSSPSTPGCVAGGRTVARARARDLPPHSRAFPPPHRRAACPQCRGGAHSFELTRRARSFVPPLFAEATEARPCPPTPYRPLHKMSRQDSLRETKLLVAAGGAPGSVGPTPEFDAENFTFVQLIGSSPTSEVWLVRSRHDGSLSAVKRSVAAFTGRADRARMLREIQAAASMPDHPRVVRYYRGWQQDAHFYVQARLSRSVFKTTATHRACRNPTFPPDGAV